MPDLSERMMPALTPQNRALWTGGKQGQLLIQRCTSCGRWVNPPRAACDACGGPLEAQPASGKGTIFTFTVNAHPFNPIVPLPYVIAIVELAEQADLRFFTNIVNCEPSDLRVGMPVRVLFEDHEEISIPIFEPDPDA